MGNHHMELVEYTDKKDNKKWKGYVVSTLEATLRNASNGILEAKQLVKERPNLSNLNQGISQLVDVDGDSNLDIISVGKTAGGTGLTTVQFGNGDGSFSSSLSFNQ